MTTSPSPFRRASCWRASTRSCAGRRPLARKRVIAIEGLVLDGASHRVTVGEQTVSLGPTEYRLLSFFMMHPERVYSRNQLLDRVWGGNVYVEERTVDVHIRRLRKALERLWLRQVHPDRTRRRLPVLGTRGLTGVRDDHRPGHSRSPACWRCWAWRWRADSSSAGRWCGSSSALAGVPVSAAGQSLSARALAEASAISSIRRMWVAHGRTS